MAIHPFCGMSEHPSKADTSAPTGGRDMLFMCIIDPFTPSERADENGCEIRVLAMLLVSRWVSLLVLE